MPAARRRGGKRQEVTVPNDTEVPGFLSPGSVWWPTSIAPVTATGARAIFDELLAVAPALPLFCS